MHEVYCGCTIALCPGQLLKWKGFDTLHTDDLPNKEKTTDTEIRLLSIEEDRIVITKDSDFLDSYFVKGVPPKLLLISTGNIKNQHLLSIFEKNIGRVVELFQQYKLIEMDNIEIIVHE